MSDQVTQLSAHLLNARRTVNIGVIEMRNRLLVSAVAALACASGSLTVPAIGNEPSPIIEGKSQPLSAALQDIAADEFVPPEVLVTTAERVIVDVRLQAVSEAALAALRGIGAHIKFIDTDQRLVTAAIDPGDVESLAALPQVEYAREVLRPRTNAACPSGMYVSEGLAQLRADVARSTHFVTGRNVTVGVMSDTYNRLDGAEADVAGGELPGSGNPCGRTTAVDLLEEGPAADASDEGRAMAQIVHDIAPDAKILFATAYYSPSSFAQNIRDLAAAGADIIVDDVTWAAEPFYQDGVIARAVADVSAAGVTYFSSAANLNVVANGRRIGSYESILYRPNTCPKEIDDLYKGVTVDCHDFDPTVGVDTTYGFSYKAAIGYVLGWNQPQHGVTVDFDVCLINDFHIVLKCAKDNNILSQEAYEFVSASGDWNGMKAHLAIVRVTGNAVPRLKLIRWGGELIDVDYTTTELGNFVGPTTFGHNASRPGVTVAAVPFNAAGQLEEFSSWGPATYCWEPVVGTVPAAPLIPCQTATVDVAATDGTQNSFFGGISGGFHRFYGTSAAAPHAAGVAALILDREPCLTQPQVVAHLKTGARTVGSAGVDGAGAGLVDAQAAVTAAGVAKCDKTAPVVKVTPVHATPSGWFTGPVSTSVSATDPRTVKSITCTNATMSGFSGPGNPTATAKLTTVGEGALTITCSAADAEGNTGASFGSATSISVKVDSLAPTLTCRPSVFSQGAPATVTADVTDQGSGPATGTASVPVATGTPGAFTATVAAKDVAGNTATADCGFVVTAGPDTQPPVLTCRAAHFVVGQHGVVTADATDSGANLGTVSAKVETPSPGTYEVTLTASDSAGNVGRVSCPYAVRAVVVGRTHVKVGKRVTYSVPGLTGRVRWTVTRAGKQVIARKPGRTLTLRFTKPGRYQVRATTKTTVVRQAVVVR